MDGVLFFFIFLFFSVWLYLLFIRFSDWNFVSIGTIESNPIQSKGFFFSNVSIHIGFYHWFSVNRTHLFINSLPWLRGGNETKHRQTEALQLHTLPFDTILDFMTWMAFHWFIWPCIFSLRSHEESYRNHIEIKKKWKTNYHWIIIVHFSWIEIAFLFFLKNEQKKKRKTFLQSYGVVSMKSLD